jgi:hypothetical protein
MVYLLKMGGSFHGYVSHNHMVSITMNINITFIHHSYIPTKKAMLVITRWYYNWLYHISWLVNLL